MEPRISLITLGVKDLEQSYQFYKEGLGLPTTRTPSDGIVFFQTSGVTLAIYPVEELASDVGPDWNTPRAKFSGITLAHNVRHRQEVDTVLASAAEAGATIVKPAADKFWAVTPAISLTPTDTCGRSRGAPSKLMNAGRSSSRELPTTLAENN